MIFPSDIRGNPFFYSSRCCKSDNEEDRLVWFYFSKLYNLAITRIEWINLPPEIPPAYLEDVLFWYGAALFVYDDVADMFAVKQLQLSGIPDAYNIPDMRCGITANGDIQWYNKLDSVIIWDKPVLYPTFEALYIYAERLAKAHMTGDLNLLTKRTPIIAYGVEEQKLTIVNVINKIKTWVPFIKVKNNVYDPIENMKTLNFATESIFIETENFKTNVWCEALNYLGIEYFVSQKKERLVSGESEGNAGDIEQNRFVALTPRQRAADQINALFGLEGEKRIQVKFRSDMITAINAPEAIGGVQNEPVHDNNQKLPDERVE